MNPEKPSASLVRQLDPTWSKDAPVSAAALILCTGVAAMTASVPGQMSWPFARQSGQRVVTMSDTLTQVGTMRSVGHAAFSARSGNPARATVIAATRVPFTGRLSVRHVSANATGHAGAAFPHRHRAMIAFPAVKTKTPVRTSNSRTSSPNSLGRFDDPGSSAEPDLRTGLASPGLTDVATSPRNGVSRDRADIGSATSLDSAAAARYGAASDDGTDLPVSPDAYSEMTANAHMRDDGISNPQQKTATQLTQRVQMTADISQRPSGLEPTKHHTGDKGVSRLAGAKTSIDDIRQIEDGIEFSINTQVNGASAGRLSLLIAGADIEHPEYPSRNFSIRVSDILNILRPRMNEELFDKLVADELSAQYVSFDELRSHGISVSFDRNDRLQFAVS